MSPTWLGHWYLLSYGLSGITWQRGACLSELSFDDSSIRWVVDSVNCCSAERSVSEIKLKKTWADWFSIHSVSELGPETTRAMNQKKSNATVLAAFVLFLTIQASQSFKITKIRSSETGETTIFLHLVMWVCHCFGPELKAGFYVDPILSGHW